MFFFPLPLTLSFSLSPFTTHTLFHRKVLRALPHLQSGRQTVLMKILVPWEGYISPSSFLARCGQETPPAVFYLSQLLLHSQHSAWLNWPFAITLKSCKHCLLYHSVLAQQAAANKVMLVNVLLNFTSAYMYDTATKWQQGPRATHSLSCGIWTNI